MNLNSREIRRLNTKSFLIDVAFGVVAVAAKTAFPTWAASVFLHFRPSVYSVVKLVFGRLFVFHSFVYSLLCHSFSCYCLCRGHLSLI